MGDDGISSPSEHLKYESDSLTIGWSPESLQIPEEISPELQELSLARSDSALSVVSSEAEEVASLIIPKTINLLEPASITSAIPWPVGHPVSLKTRCKSSSRTRSDHRPFSVCKSVSEAGAASNE